MLVLRLRLRTLYQPAFGSAFNSEPTAAFARRTENPEILMLWSGPGGAAVSKPLRPPPPAKALSSNLINAQGISVGLIVCNSLKNVITEQKHRYWAKKMLTSA
jgi:hypothetical protein